MKGRPMADALRQYQYRGFVAFTVPPNGFGDLARALGTTSTKGWQSVTRRALQARLQTVVEDEIARLVAVGGSPNIPGRYERWE